jgi:hypothetical protein
LGLSSRVNEGVAIRFSPLGYSIGIIFTVVEVPAFYNTKLTPDRTEWTFNLSQHSNGTISYSYGCALGCIGLLFS